jgi:hypothetical protein
MSQRNYGPRFPIVVIVVLEGDARVFHLGVVIGWILLTSLSGGETWQIRKRATQEVVG